MLAKKSLENTLPALRALPRELARRVRPARELADERRRAPREECLSTASALDRLLAGGLERGTMIELIGRRSSGRFALVQGVLAAVTETGEAAALIDLGDGLDPRSAVAAGVVTERLLWVRPRRMKEALAGAELVMSSGMPVVVIDLGLPPLAGGRGAEAAWLRLARSARAHRAALLVASPYRVTGTAPREVLELRAARARWQGDGRQGDGRQGDGRPPLLCGLDGELEVVKSRSRRPAEHREHLGLRVEEAEPAMAARIAPPVAQETPARKVA